MNPNAWPALPLEEWLETYSTLHRWTQIVGKTRLSHTPMQNHWWNATLYVTSRGLGTAVMGESARQFDVEFDFVDHKLVVRTNDRTVQTIPLRAMSVAEFYHEYTLALKSLEIEPHVWPVPMELTDTLRFDEDTIHSSYDPAAAERCWQALAQTDRVLKIFRGRYTGKSSPSHFWWGSFDISCTRFSGRRAPVHPGGVPNCPDYVTREAYSHECASVGWWPGSPGGIEEPAFYAYAYPEPAGFADAKVNPAEAYYQTGIHEWILPYDAVRNARDPDATLLAFCGATYSAAAALGSWDRALLEHEAASSRESASF
jgi:uncharacterized protein DUF5996